MNTYQKKSPEISPESDAEKWLRITIEHADNATVLYAMDLEQNTTLVQNWLATGLRDGAQSVMVERFTPED